MRLPFVSRARFDEAQRAYDVACSRGQQWGAELQRAVERYDALLEKYHALKLAGATLPPPVVPYMPKEADPYDELKALIADQAGSDLRRRGMMLRQLNKDRQDGVPPEEIRRSIETGVQSQGIPV